MTGGMVSPLGRRLTRREMLRWGIAGGALAVGGGVRGSAWAEAAMLGEKVLTVGTFLDIKTLDPGRTNENQVNNVNHVAYDTLVTFTGEDLKTVRPWLATTWTISADGRTYTFTLRPNVKFAGGNPLTSADVKWSFDRIMAIKGPGSFTLNGVDEVRAPDPLTVTLHLREPEPALLAIMTDPVLSPLDSKVVVGHGGDAGPDAREKDKAEAWLNQNSAGSGSYVMTGYTPRQQLLLVKNPNHWRGAPAFDRIVIRNIGEPSDQAIMVAKGDLDIAVNLGRTEADTLRRVSSLVVKSSLNLNVVNVAMNNNPQVGGPFSNPKVQDAVRYALDYDGILKLTDPGSVRAAGVIPTTLPGARPTSEAPKMDRERARALLREANAGDVTGSFAFSPQIAGYGVDTSLLSQKIQQDLAQVGIKISLNAMPYPVWIDLERAGKMQVGLLGWNADYMDASDYLLFLPGEVVGKRMGWLPDHPQAQEVLRLGKMAQTETNAAKRVAHYQDVDRRLAAGPFVPLYQPSHAYAYRANLRNVTWVTGWFVDYGTISRA